MNDTTERRTVGVVFWASLSISALFVVWGVAAPEHQTATMDSALNWITSSFGWAYLLLPLLLLALLTGLACSRYGRIRLGSDEDRPEFATHTWIAMILCTVMGIGLVSYGIAEPISHFTTPPHGLAEAGTPGAAVLALQYSFYDWGLHAWAIFAIFGLALAYSMHRKKRPGLVSALFRPLLGRHADGPLGKAIDVFTVFATLFGTTTSLGLGALQIDNGLNRLLGTPTGITTQVVIVVVVTALFSLSAASGIKRGIRYISEINLSVAAVLFLFVLLLGPTAFLISLLLESFGQYGGDFLLMSLRGPAFGDTEWLQGWTYFMMAWWVSWGAFVGLFLARISRGRTIRQFVLVVLGMPSLAFFAWFSVFGGSAIDLDLNHGTDIAGATAADLNSAFFATLAEFPIPSVTTALVVILAVLFFVSGADANTYVLGMLTTHGSIRPRTPILLLWGAMTGALAIILLFSGGLNALQQTVIVASAPFLVIIVGVVVSFCRDLRSEERAESVGAPTAHPAADDEPAVEASAPLRSD
ncbi:BCCT family transporter [Nocardiopsis terrae]|uniref:Choline/carnitine/betaine transport n=1 Tax=Nocardiopsis terrae TaxID=372655 RepID=A0ABR9HDW2_9ACTN|nr:BCCT family transporter [Nocardiopsis terrae]MBE1457223.1 choline/carnitine/betaine transport [Nocardiopsis terrae]GHC91233.1 BCCT family transporter [Nocardiopsis terrae]